MLEVTELNELTELITLTKMKALAEQTDLLILLSLVICLILPKYIHNTVKTLKLLSILPHLLIYDFRFKGNMLKRESLPLIFV